MAADSEPAALAVEELITPVEAQPVSQIKLARQEIFKIFIETCFSTGEGLQKCSLRRGLMRQNLVRPE